MFMIVAALLKFHSSLSSTAEDLHDPPGSVPSISIHHRHYSHSTNFSISTPLLSGMEWSDIKNIDLNALWSHCIRSWHRAEIWRLFISADRTASISFLCGMTTKIQAFYYGLIDSYTMTAVVIGEYVCALIYGCQVTSKEFICWWDLSHDQN